MSVKTEGSHPRVGNSQRQVFALHDRTLKQLRRAFCLTHHLAMSPHRHVLLTICNLTPGNTDRRFKHERDYSEENGFPRNSQGSTREKNSDQRKFEENLDHPSVNPRTSARLLRERKQVGVCRRGVVLCDNRGDLSLANLCSRRRIAGIFPTRIELTVIWGTHAPGVPFTAPSPQIPARNGLWLGTSAAIGEGANRRTRGACVPGKISTASSSRLACWPRAKRCSCSKQSGN